MRSIGFSSHPIKSLELNILPMNSRDISKLSYPELLELSKKLDQEIAAKRIEELKVLADGYIKKAEAAGFTAVEAVAALQPYIGGATKPKRRSAGSPEARYRDPANPENTWTGRGMPARWLANYEAQGRSRDEFKI